MIDLSQTGGDLNGYPLLSAQLQALLSGERDFIANAAQFSAFLFHELADLALASQLINMEHGGETLDAGRWPNLLAHYERIKARASTQQLLPRELRTLEKIGAKR